jgi:hypothetical protein
MIHMNGPALLGALALLTAIVYCIGMLISDGINGREDDHDRSAR